MGGSGEQELIVFNGYDELGQLIAKKVGGAPGTEYDTTEGLQTVDYAYNIRGWLTAINGGSATGEDLFGFGINYNTVDHEGTALYNGNIAETEWITKNDNVLRWYRYGYDPLNRIINAVDNTTNYNVTGITYDKNGNIQMLNRRGVVNSANGIGDMDKLIYDYFPNSNQLRSLDEGSGGSTVHGFKDASTASIEYRYDANGNMTFDANKGIAADGIEYNHLNMPTKITVSSGSNTGTLDYIYSADGTKLQKVNSNGVTTDYARGFVYENGTLVQFFHPEGYIEPDGSGGYTYIYQYRD